MRTLRTVHDLRTTLGAERAAGRSVALVPTMGGLHEGHLSLIRAARSEHDVVVVSLFVNPAQFSESSDLASYPRDEATDAALAARAGTDLLFAPSQAEVYPDGFAASVQLRGLLTETLEGEHRGPAHFDGVTTVVAKLFGMAAPDAAFFGAKDAQQLRVVRRMTSDLNLPVRIVACPTVREPDGLAMSSRNARLDPEQRQSALGLSRALGEVARGLADARYASVAEAESAGLAVLTGHGCEPEYFRVVDPESMAPVALLSGYVLLVTAAHVGRVRLIDNAAVSAGWSPSINNATTTIDAELTQYEPRVVHVRQHTNQIINVDDEVATLLA